MPRKTKTRQTLSVADWVRAALVLMAREGVQAVAVEPLAREIGVTKGSFYWHFENRDHLVKTALTEWEQDQGRDLVQRYAEILDPRHRLRVLIHAAFEDTHNGLLFAALGASSEDPLVKPFLARVTALRMEFGVKAFRDLGLPEDEARRRALFTYAAYAGYFQLLRAMPDTVKAVSDLSAYAKGLVEAVVSA
jgi:AcrR family transcriptional regulator